MKRLLAYMLAAALLLGAANTPVHAQSADVEALNELQRGSSLGVQPMSSPTGWLDLSRATFSHSYSLTYFSGGGTSGSLGLWTSAMRYEFSDHLRLTLNLGVLHDGGAIFGSDFRSDRNTTFLPGFRLEYQPSDKVYMSVSFQRYAGGYGPYGYQPFGYRDWRYPGNYRY